jgi:hypothetical protein
LELIKSEVSEAIDITADDVKRAAAVSGAKPHWPALGAYTSKTGYRADIYENAETEADGSYCAKVASVNLVISLNDRVIHLARELERDRCLEAQRRLLKQRADSAAGAIAHFSVSELEDAVAKMIVRHVDSIDLAKAELATAVHHAIELGLDRVGTFRAELNKKVDASIGDLRRQFEGKV